MQAIRYDRYGLSDALRLDDIDRPAPAAGQLVIKVRAAAVNPADNHTMHGTPYAIRLMTGLRRPKFHGLGGDVAGVVDSVGAGVDTFRPGDEVFGCVDGTFAEYVRVPADAALAAKPSTMTFEEAAAVPLAGVTALQALRKAKVRAGHKVLVHGASSGIGTFTVQLAKASGAEVTGVCSGRNVELVRSLGADRVIDYTEEDFVADPARYDVAIQTAGGRSLADYRRVLTPKGALVVVGEPLRGLLIRPLLGPLRRAAVSPFVSPRLLSMLTRVRAADLVELRDHAEAGRIRSAIDRTYPLSKVPEALDYLVQGHARGKVVITV